jgi:hypothetical protein
LLTLDIVAQHETSAQVGLVKPVADSSKRTWVQAGTTMTARALSLSLQSLASLTSPCNEHYPGRRSSSTCSATDRHTQFQDSTAIFSVNKSLIIEFYNLVMCLSGDSKSDSLAKAIQFLAWQERDLRAGSLTLNTFSPVPCTAIFSAIEPEGIRPPAAAKAESIPSFCLENCTAIFSVNEASGRCKSLA